MNTFDALNIFYREDTISDFLVTCFKDSPPFTTRFLHEAGIKLEEGFSFDVKTRVGLGKTIGTPDIVIRASSGDRMKLIIIENKMGAAEGHEQTNRYESSEARARIAKRYKMPLEKIEFHFIFLALDTTAQPKNSQFIFLNYQIFLKDSWHVNDEKLRLLFNDFQEKLAIFYRPIEKPLESLETNLKMDGMQRKICWQAILYDAFSANKDLLLRWGEVGGAGRNNFLFLITKTNWTSNESFHEAGLSKTFNVHIDTYINMLDNRTNNVNEIGIRFETYPYVPHKKIQNHPEYQRFLDNKTEFGERLYELAKRKGISVKRKNSKLLVLAIPIHGETIGDTVQHMKTQVEAIEACVDQVIGEMMGENLIK
ncbi:hypothetical protein CHH83_18925 [Bacillus sp. 7586-K]|nr:hypothetical protein CHH83_18925 [Bacillus sp. 7586-K]